MTFNPVRAVCVSALVAMVLIPTGLLLGAVPIAQAATTSNQSTEVGVTPTAIHLAVIADVNNSIIPGLFAGTVRGVKAWASQINQQGGLAGRKVVVDFYDSQLSPTQARNTVIE